MRVELLAYTPEAQVIVAAAAKLCYSASDIEAIMQKQTPEVTEKFLNTLAAMGHESPIEHAVFTFGIEGVSRALLAQITRHRIASFSVQSQRYVNMTDFNCVVPPRIAENPEALAIYNEAVEETKSAYTRLAEVLVKAETEQYVSEGMEPEAAAKKASKAVLEDARFILPNGCETKMVVTMNARSLYNFFSLRCCERAQWEIRAVADEMLRLVKQACPQLFSKAGPKCVRGACGEGAMSCGKTAAIREKYKNL